MMPAFQVKALLLLSACFFAAGQTSAQYVSGKGNDATMPLHLMKPDYDIPYGAPTPEKIKLVLDRVYRYLNEVTPMSLVHKDTETEVKLANADETTILKKGDFRLTSYEWGVTYTGMLEVAAATDDQRYAQYSRDRINFLGDVVKHYKDLQQKKAVMTSAVRSVMQPHALDDAGSLCAAMIKSLQTGAKENTVRPMVDNFINYIMTKEFRLNDGTLARNRPLPNTLWLDDLYMSLPALAQMGKLTGNVKYFDEAIRQYHLFADRMFNNQNNLYMHGWVQGMDPHPQFHWARANGWAIMTKVELLDVLPESHPGRKEILTMLKKHAGGLAMLQDRKGFWHQLLDKNDSYLETSATAIYAYCLARAINKGWLDARAYGPMVILAWNAVASKITDAGQVEGTCVGTGMGFDPAFYYYRPVSNFAAHGYGPVLLAGAAVYQMLKTHTFDINDSAVQMK